MQAHLFTCMTLLLALLISLFPTDGHARQRNSVTQATVRNPHALPSNISTGDLPLNRSRNSTEQISSCDALLRNTSFEDGFISGPSDWNADAWNGNGSQAQFTWDDTQHRDGNKSVKISLSTPNDARWIQTVTVQPNTNYILSGWIKTENVGHTAEPVDAGANLSLYGTWTRSEGIFGTNDWTYVILPFNSGESTQVTIGARLGYWAGTTTGTAWFDSLCLGQTDTIGNPDFESGLFDWPYYWEPESIEGTASFEWDASTVHGGGRSIKTFAADQSIARWSQTVFVDPDSEYELGGWIKTSDVQGAGAKIGIFGLEDSYLAAATTPLDGTQDWTFVSVRFITGRTTSATIVCTLGERAPYRSETSSGTMWCDDFTLTKIRSLSRTSQSGGHIALNVYSEDWTFNDPMTYIARLDEIYDALADLVGATPYNGALITVRSDASMYAGLLSGKTIRIGPGGGWADIVNSHGMDFGVPHELGHDFDFAPRDSFYMGVSLPFDNAEHWANFKALYAFDLLGGRYPSLRVSGVGGVIVPLGQLGQTFIDNGGAQAWIDQGRTDYQNMGNDVYTGLLYTLVKRLGWAPFKCVFRAYGSSSAPAPTTDEGKVQLWANTLSNCAGMDLTPDFRSWGFPVQRTIVNVLANPGFEIDADNDGRPDSWSANNRVTRSNVLVHSGSYAMRHFATNNASYTIGQTIANARSQQYNFSGWVNIPATSDTFTFKLQLEWRDARNRVIRTDLLKTYSGATNSWDKFSFVLAGPTGTTSVNVQMVVSSLNATIYVDDFAFGW